MPYYLIYKDLLIKLYKIIVHIYAVISYLKKVKLHFVKHINEN
jgi:hypothetical protein